MGEIDGADGNGRSLPSNDGTRSPVADGGDVASMPSSGRGSAEPPNEKNTTPTREGGGKEKKDGDDGGENGSGPGITVPRENDVLCGRGGGRNNHPGNEQFREMVSSNKKLYLESCKKDKTALSRAIVGAIHDRGGRFLQKDEPSNVWHDIGEQKAIEKTAQALREGAPAIRKELGLRKRSIKPRTTSLVGEEAEAQLAAQQQGRSSDGRSASQAFGIPPNVPAPGGPAVLKHFLETQRPDGVSPHLRGGRSTSPIGGPRSNFGDQGASSPTPPPIPTPGYAQGILDAPGLGGGPGEPRAMSMVNLGGVGDGARIAASLGLQLAEPDGSGPRSKSFSVSRHSPRVQSFQVATLPPLMEPDALTPDRLPTDRQRHVYERLKLEQQRIEVQQQKRRASQALIDVQHKFEQEQQHIDRKMSMQPFHERRTTGRDMESVAASYPGENIPSQHRPTSVMSPTGIATGEPVHAKRMRSESSPRLQKLSEDVESRLEVAETVADAFRRGSAQDVQDVKRNMKLYQTLGLLGVHIDAIHDSLARGMPLDSLVEEATSEASLLEAWLPSLKPSSQSKKTNSAAPQNGVFDDSEEMAEEKVLDLPHATSRAGDQDNMYHILTDASSAPTEDDNGKMFPISRVRAAVNRMGFVK